MQLRAIAPHTTHGKDKETFCATKQPARKMITFSSLGFLCRLITCIITVQNAGSLNCKQQSLLWHNYYRNIHQENLKNHAPGLSSYFTLRRKTTITRRRRSLMVPGTSLRLFGKTRRKLAHSAKKETTVKLSWWSNILPLETSRVISLKTSSLRESRQQ